MQWHNGFPTKHIIMPNGFFLGDLKFDTHPDVYMVTGMCSHKKRMIRDGRWSLTGYFLWLVLTFGIPNSSQIPYGHIKRKEKKHAAAAKYVACIHVT